MINIFIDDSGTRNLKEVDQPIFLFSAICIKNSDTNRINSEISNLLMCIRTKLNNILLESISSQKYSKEKTEKVANMIADKVIGGKLELHCAEMLRGDEVYMFFDKEDRKTYIKNALQIIKGNNIKVITVYCGKEEYISKNSAVDINALQEQANKEVVEIMIDEINKYLIEENDQCCIIVDKGNNTIRELFIPEVRKVCLDRVSTEVLEKESHESLPIQLADICAYTSNLKFTAELKEKQNQKNKNKNIANDFYNIIDSNNIRRDISEKYDQEQAKEKVEEEKVG